MHKPNHILFLARWYPHQFDPMFGLFVQRHAASAALHNNISVVYAHSVDGQQNSKFEIETKQIDRLFEVRVYYRSSRFDVQPVARFVNLVNYFIAVLKGIRCVKEQKSEFQLIHVHILTRLALIALFYDIFYRIPYVITEHWSRYLHSRNEFKGFFRKKLTQIVVKRASVITTVTQNLRNAMQHLGLKNSNYVVLPNVVDMQMFKPVERQIGRKTRIIHISCFEDRSKNISGLLRVIQQLKIQGDDFECLMIGDGADSKMLHEQALHLQLDSNVVQFCGLLQGDELANALASGDFLVLFSNYENMPVVILEALACGLPVVATNVGGIPEMINASNGMLVNAGEEQALRTTISKMITNYHSFNKTQLRTSVENTYSKESVGEFLTQLYHNVLEKHNLVK